MRDELRAYYDQLLTPEVEDELIELRRASFASQDMREGMAAFAEKRKPGFKDE